MGTMLGGVFTAPGWGLVGTRVALALTNYRESCSSSSSSPAAPEHGLEILAVATTAHRTQPNAVQRSLISYQEGPQSG